MNGILKIVGVFVGSLVLVLLLALLAVVFKPGVFHVLAPVDSLQAGSATTKAALDSLRATMVPADSVKHLADEVKHYRTTYGAMADSIRFLSEQLNDERGKIRGLGEALRASVSADDSARSAARQSLADFLGSMNAEDAANILRNMDEREAREVLIRVKKRQASKILSTLDPAEAVKIMR
jgi:flagellar motility protein MotE (MotC chaperone)